MADPIQLFPTPEYGRGATGSGDTWPPPLNIAGGPIGGIATTISLVFSQPDPDDYTGYPPPPDGYDITVLGYQLQRELFVFDISSVDWGAMDTLQFTIDGSMQGGFINAFELANSSNPSVGPMAPVHSNVHTISGDWLTGSFDDLANISDILAAYPNLYNLSGTAFDGVSILDWFNPLYIDGSTGVSQAIDPRDKVFITDGWQDVLPGNDWAGLLIGMDGVPSWFSGSFTIDTFDPEANPVTWTQWNIYEDSAQTGYNPVGGVYLTVLEGVPQDQPDDPRRRPAIALAADVPLSVLSGGLTPFGRAVNPVPSTIGTHVARRRRGW